MRFLGFMKQATVLVLVGFCLVVLELMDLCEKLYYRIVGASPINDDEEQGLLTEMSPRH